jgi:hypothetical protein
MNDKYSFKDFTGQSIVNVPVKELDGTEIVGSCFAQENGEKVIFPKEMKGVHFRRCNLDNVFIPDGNTIESEGWEKCSVRRHAAQIDGNDWIIDKDRKPLEPCDKERFIAEGKSLDPNSIREVQ